MQVEYRFRILNGTDIIARYVPRLELIDFQRYFLLERRAELRKLARFTGQSLEELEQEASVIAMELQALQPHPLDFVSADVQGEIFRKLKRRFEAIKRQSRRHTSLDQTRASADGEWSWSLGDLLPAEEHSDPLRALLRSEDRKAGIARFLEACRKTYSQFVAYLILLWHFEGERKEAANHLAITPATFDLRIGWARGSLGVQASLFDGLSFLNMDFLPPRANRKAAAPVSEDEYPDRQFSLFDANAMDGY